MLNDKGNDIVSNDMQLPSDKVSMNPRSWKILLVDDDQEDFLITQDLLLDAGFNGDACIWANSYQEGIEKVRAQTFDVVLVDYYLSSRTGAEFIRESQPYCHDLPFILLTGTSSIEIDLEAMKAGAVDYLEKINLTPRILERTIRYAIERGRLQAEVRRQGELLHSIFDIDPGALAIVSGTNLTFQYANPAYQAILPQGIISPIGKEYTDVWPPPEGCQILTAIQAAMQSEPVDIDRMELTQPDGSVQYYSCRIRKIDWNGGPAVLIALWDVTSIERANQRAERSALEVQEAYLALQESNSRFRVALHNSPVSVYTNDRDLRYTWIYHPHHGYREDDVIGKRDNELFPEPIGSQLLAIKQNVLDGGVGVRTEVAINTHGTEYIYDMTIEPLIDPSGKIVGITASETDITERKRMEEERQANSAKLEVQRLLIQHREMERMQIARDLHDGPLQALIGVTYGLAEAREIPDKNNRLAKLTYLQERLHEEIRSVRAFCNELRPPALAPFGVEKAIRSHLESIIEQFPGFTVNLELTPDGQSIPEEIRMALFRIYQELMNNILRHAHATQVSIGLWFEEGSVILVVQDNGVGFDISERWIDLARQGHLGLVGMRERAEAAGGTVQVFSAPGRGTKVQVRVPAGTLSA